MAGGGSIEIKQLQMRDLVYLIAALAAVISVVVPITSRITSLEVQQQDLTKKIDHVTAVIEAIAPNTVSAARIQTAKKTP